MLLLYLAYLSFYRPEHHLPFLPYTPEAEMLIRDAGGDAVAVKEREGESERGQRRGSGYREKTKSRNVKERVEEREKGKRN